MKELFKRGLFMVNFTWHSNPFGPKIHLDILFSIYNDLGVQNISHVIEKTEISMPQKIPFQKIQLEEEILGMGVIQNNYCISCKAIFQIVF